MKLSQLIPSKNISMLLKGANGMGKTISACTFAVEGPIYVFDFDGRMLPVLTYFKKYCPELLDNVNYDTYSSHNANEFLNKLIGFTKDCRYTAIITDSVTSLTASAINWSLGFRGSKVRKSNEPNLIPDFDAYKVETSLVSQALDIMKMLPCHIILTAHPLPSLSMSGSGSSMIVSKVTSIVSYGQKVGAIVPGYFNEIYHFARRVDYNDNTNRRIVLTDMVGDDFAKTALDIPKEFDITNKLFYTVWKELADKSRDIEPKKELTEEELAARIANPFTQPTTQTWKT
jgi:hypothetical protein